LPLLGRVDSPDDIAGIVSFLAGPSKALTMGGPGRSSTRQTAVPAEDAMVAVRAGDTAGVHAYGAADDDWDPARGGARAAPGSR
jgi:hypothetical protein